MIVARIEGLDRLKDELGKRYPARMQRVLVSALNRQITSTRAAAVKAIRGLVALPAAYVRERLVLRRASGDRLEAAIVAKRRGVLLSRFRYTQRTQRAEGGGRKGAGIAVTVRPGKRRLMPGAFLVPLRAGRVEGGNGMGIAVRTTRSRYPIKVLHGPSVSQVFNAVRNDLAPEAAAKFKSEVERRLSLSAADYTET